MADSALFGLHGRMLSFAPADRQARQASTGKRTGIRAAQVNANANAVPPRRHREPELEPAPGWFLKQYASQTRVAREHEERAALRQACSASRMAIRPRIYVYELPPELLPPPTLWRGVRALKIWIEHSAYYEPNPHCADYYVRASQYLSEHSHPTFSSPLRCLTIPPHHSSAPFLRTIPPHPVSYTHLTLPTKA